MYYLCNINQMTRIDNNSDKIQNGYDVPKGSILGVLLFKIYINDMPKIIKNCDLILYADDTLIYSIGENDEECKRKRNCDILILNEWLKINPL